MGLGHADRTPAALIALGPDRGVLACYRVKAVGVLVRLGPTRSRGLMSWPKIRIRALMVGVALTAVLLAWPFGLCGWMHGSFLAELAYCSVPPAVLLAAAVSLF